MSSNDSTRPDADGRTVATEPDGAGQAPPETAGNDDSVTSANGRVSPSPTPREQSDATAPETSDVDTGGAHPTAEADPVAEAAEPAPAAGPVEGPPPWRRVPGERPVDPEPAPVRQSVNSLLSEAPTEFLTAPKAGSSGSRTAAPDTPGTAEPSDTSREDRPRGRPPRQALLQLKRLDPWSVLKMALALAVVLFLIWMVAAGVLYGVLGGMGVWDRLNGTYADLVTGQDQNVSSLISPGRVFLLAAVVGAINSLLFAVALTILAFVYNVAADLVGGIEVTLSERD